MWLRLYLIFMILCFIPSSAIADDKEKNHVLWQLRDLYYYDANGVMAQLDLAPKLLVRFTSDTAKEKRSQFLFEFSPIAEKEEPSDPSRTLVEFHESTKPFKLIEIANKISRSGIAQASPVFFVENIEAVIGGIIVEPKTVLTPDRLEERMKKYGDFSSRQAMPENGAWVLLLDNVKPPLNILILINLMNMDSWVRRASPRFHFLHDPIVASTFVEPVSGTVGEVRTITFAVKIFDQKIKLLEDQLPQFGTGLFMPIQGDLNIPSSIKYPPGYLFEVMGGPTNRPVRIDKRSRTYTTSWKFKQHALGEWTIPPQPVSYSKNGVESEIKSSGFTLVVNSQIGNLQITDMPTPLTLIHPVEKPVSSPDLTLPAIPLYWFDARVSDAKRVARYTEILGIFFGMAAVISIGVPTVRCFWRKKKITAYHRDKINLINHILYEAGEIRSYEKYNEALLLILTLAFSHLSSRPSWEEIKDDALVCKKLGVEIMVILEETFYELGRQDSRNFMVTAESLALLSENIRKVKEAV